MNPSRPNKLIYALFILGVLGTGMVIGRLAAPGEWYQALVKPAFHPPDWVFAPVWSVLYVLIGIVGGRIWTLTRDALLKVLWITQMWLNFLWSPAFFGLESIGGALAVILALLAAIVAFIGYGWRRERVSAMMFLPYLAWVAFAALLNLSIYRLN